MRCASCMTVSAAVLSAAMRSAKLGWLSIRVFGELAVKARPARSLPPRLRHSCAPPQARGQDGKPTAKPAAATKATRVLRPCLRWGIDHEKSRAAAAAVPGTYFRTRREEGTIGY